MSVSQIIAAELAHRKQFCAKILKNIQMSKYIYTYLYFIFYHKYNRFNKYPIHINIYSPIKPIILL